MTPDLIYGYLCIAIGVVLGFTALDLWKAIRSYRHNRKKKE